MAGNVLHKVHPNVRAIICLSKCGVACDPLDPLPSQGSCVPPVFAYCKLLRA